MVSEGLFSYLFIYLFIYLFVIFFISDKIERLCGYVC